jgi:hypothetical protein
MRIRPAADRVAGTADRPVLRGGAAGLAQDLERGYRRRQPLLIWTADGGERAERAADFVVGAGRTTLQAGEVLRSITFPSAALASRAAFRRISLAPLGRSGAVVIGRRSREGAVTMCVTAATGRPVLVAELAQLDAVGCWYSDPHGSPEWRAHVSRLLATEVIEELR